MKIEMRRIERAYKQTIPMKVKVNGNECLGFLANRGSEQLRGSVASLHVLEVITTYIHDEDFRPQSQEKKTKGENRLRNQR